MLRSSVFLTGNLLGLTILIGCGPSVTGDLASEIVVDSKKFVVDSAEVVVNSAHSVDETTGKRTSARDLAQLPVTEQVFVSPSKRFEFKVSAADAWKTPLAIGELVEVVDNARRSVWKRELDQPFGPRFVLLRNDGTLLMLDEWQNVKSQWAVVLRNPLGKLTMELSLSELVDKSGLEIREFTAVAKYGWWIESKPYLSENDERVYVPAAGSVVSIDLGSGAWRIL